MFKSECIFYKKQKQNRNIILYLDLVRLYDIYREALPNGKKSLATPHFLYSKSWICLPKNGLFQSTDFIILYSKHKDAQNENSRFKLAVAFFPFAGDPPKYMTN